MFTILFITYIFLNSFQTIFSLLNKINSAFFITLSKYEKLVVNSTKDHFRNYLNIYDTVVV